ncbi:hypothetical protein M9Y10_034191 [Tritrichomonas musculus]|uniref:Uncharacterized protein n=1 Tax=Tritrichomonas musculus TaxID=1915356 RepID=A0ABR2KEF0_9EUKA
MNEKYLICDFLGEYGYSIFPNAQTLSNQPFLINGFAPYVLSHHLDCPSYPFYCILYPEPTKSAYVISIVFNGSTPDFSSLGLETRETKDGTVIVVSESLFNSLDLQYSCIRVKHGNYFADKESYRQLGQLFHLGIIHDYSPLEIHDIKEYLESLTNTLHQEYGTCGSLSEALNTTFRRVKWAIHFFNIENAVTTCARYQLDDMPSFGALLPSLESSPEIRSIRNFDIFSNKSINTSPFFVLINYLRTVFMGIHHDNPSIIDIDNYEEIEDWIHEFQRKHSLHEGNCDIKTAMKIIKCLNLTTYNPLPIFRMAGIDISLYSEVDFPGLIPVSRTATNSNDANSRLIKEMNHSISNTPDPKVKIDWMKDKIKNELDQYTLKCNELSDYVSTIEDRVMNLSEKIIHIMEESEMAAKSAEEAEKALDIVFKSHMNIQNKFDSFSNSLTGEQRNTKMILIFGLFFMFIGISRFFLNYK